MSKLAITTQARFDDCIEELNVEQLRNSILDIGTTKTIIYKSVCTCGALHTSRPGYHLSYCDIK
jgi:hypothetical protein